MLTKASLSLALTLALASMAAGAADPAVLNLEAQASLEVPQDLGRAALYAEKEAQSASEAQNQVNKVVGEAIQQAKRRPGITVVTTGYQTYPVYSQKAGDLKGWRVRASIQLESKDFAQLSDTTALLSRNMNLDGITFVLSRENREKTEATLSTDAIKAFQDKAARAAKAFGKNQYQLKEVTVGQDGAQVMPMAGRPVMMSAKAMAFEGASAPMESGKTLVTVTVRGSVTLD